MKDKHFGIDGKNDYLKIAAERFEIKNEDKIAESRDN